MIIVLGILALIVIAIFTLEYFHRSVSSIPDSVPMPAPTSVELINSAGAAWYSLSHNVLTAATGPAGINGISPSIILEAASSSIGMLVLAQTPPSSNVILALLNNEALKPLISNSTDKNSLVVVPSGIAAYANIGSNGSTVELINAKNSSTTAHPIEKGRPFAALSNGNFLVVTSGGIQLLDSATMATSSLIASTRDFSLAAAFDSSTNRIAYVNPATYGIDIYTFDLGTAQVSYQYSIRRPVPVTAVAFVDSQYLLAETASSTMEFYELPTTPGGSVLHLSTFSIPQTASSTPQ